MDNQIINHTHINIRFTRYRVVYVKMNKNFAIKLVAEEPVTDTEARVVSCDGGGGALGHPKVYINLVRAWTIKVVCHSK